MGRAIKMAKKEWQTLTRKEAEFEERLQKHEDRIAMLEGLCEILDLKISEFIKIYQKTVERVSEQKEEYEIHRVGPGPDGYLIWPKDKGEKDE